jgi:hypothetical protein
MLPQNQAVRSPVGMPSAWEIVAVQFGCLGLWLWQRQRLRISDDRNPWRDQHPQL